MTRAEATVLWRRLCASWRWEADDGRSVVWLDRLERWDQPTASAAVDCLIDTAQRPPTVAALNQAVASVVAARSRDAAMIRDAGDRDPGTAKGFVPLDESMRRLRAMRAWWSAEVKADPPQFGSGHPKASVVAPLLDDCAERCEVGWVATDARAQMTVRPCGHCRPVAYERWSRGEYRSATAGPRR